MNREKAFDLGSILASVQEELERRGVAFSVGGDAAECCVSGEMGGVKVVCVAPGLRGSVEELGKSPRDQVVMMRVDSETCAALDAWVESGVVKSRSEAAALFVREGLKVRADELERLESALQDVAEARERLRRQAQEVFGAGGSGDEATESPET